MASSAGETFDGHAVHLEVTPMIQSARRIENYHYAIRHLASAAETLTRAGREVIYLSIGDPQVYGFRPLDHIVEPVTRAIRNSFTGALLSQCSANPRRYR